MEIIPKTIKLPFLGSSVLYLGPDLDVPAPTFFYFCAAGIQTLTSEPFVTPLKSLSPEIRIMTLSLPYHIEGENNRSVLENIWAQKFCDHDSFLESFFSDLDALFHYGLQNNWFLEGKIAAGGLSRGAFIAGNFASRHKEITHFVGWAPLTDLEACPFFSSIPTSYQAQYNLSSHLSELSKKRLCFTIGNNDTAVSTNACLDFFKNLCKKAIDEGIRSPQLELKVTPSIGYRGHGTSPETFEHAALWLNRSLGL